MATRKKSTRRAKKTTTRAARPARAKKSARSKAKKKAAGKKTARKAAARAGDRPQLSIMVAALMADPELRQEFNRHPGALMERFELSQDECYCLYTMDKDDVAAEVSKQIEAFAINEGEFPPTSVNCFPEPGSQTVAYPDPDPGIYRVIPGSAAAGSREVEIVIHGKSFPPDARAELRSANSSKALGGTLFGTYRCSQLRVVIDRVPAAGSYEFWVLGNDAAPTKYQLEIGPHAFTST